MKFKFECTDEEDNSKSTLEFSAGTWVESLDYFVKFLRGNGYLVEDDSIGVNTYRHPMVSLEGLSNITEFSSIE